MSDLTPDLTMLAPLPLAFDGAEVRVVVIGDEPHFVGRDVAERLGGQSAIQVNKALLAGGFQAKAGDGAWEPTEHGRPYAVFSDTGKRHGDGTPVRQLRWSAGIVAALEAA